MAFYTVTPVKIRLITDQIFEVNVVLFLLRTSKITYFKLPAVFMFFHEFFFVFVKFKDWNEDFLFYFKK
jgi:hypothetical protein